MKDYKSKCYCRYPPVVQIYLPTARGRIWKKIVTICSRQKPLMMVTAVLSILSFSKRPKTKPIQPKSKSCEQ